MLYPIELLRHIGDRKEMRGAKDGMHVNGQACFCHVVRRLFKCRPEPTRDTGRKISFDRVLRRHPPAPAVRGNARQ